MYQVIKVQICPNTQMLGQHSQLLKYLKEQATLTQMRQVKSVHLNLTE